MLLAGLLLALAVMLLAPPARPRPRRTAAPVPEPPGTAAAVPDHPAAAPRTQTRMHHDPHDPQDSLEDDDFEDPLDRSSLGSPGAKAIRALTPPHVAQLIVDQHLRRHRQDPGAPPDTAGAGGTRALPGPPP